jgi:hypothetical protein
MIVREREEAMGCFVKGVGPAKRRDYNARMADATIVASIHREHRELYEEASMKRVCIVIIALFWFSSALAFDLITKEEAEQQDDTEVVRGGPVPGPKIEITSLPQVTSPFRFKMEIKPGSPSAPVKRSAFQVWYRKKPPIDLTGRFKSFITETDGGMRIEIDDAAVPIGKHRILFRAEDSNEQIVEQSYDFEVLPKK